MEQATYSIEDRLTTLTDKELDIFALAARGYDNPTIANIANFSKSAVSGTLQRTYRKLGIDALNKCNPRVMGALIYWNIIDAPEPN
jgi:DNA-binding CsgD family transcriptional regulator|tara:strand:+ start:1154 stop:1411 length:258 start_codon:yes stop_codon:yes gene_type:complete